MHQFNLQKEIEKILTDFRRQGIRITPVRETILEVLMSEAKPLGAAAVVQLMKDRGVSANRTTIYRELERLEKAGIVRSVQIENGRTRFEITIGEHHHHIRCLGCQKIMDVQLPNEEFTEAISSIKKQTGFTVKDHSLEFVGFCMKCVTKR